MKTALTYAAKGLVIITMFASALVAAKILDPSVSNQHSDVLRSISSDLDDQKIDVILGDSKPHSLDESYRPRVTPLAGFSPREKDWGTISQNNGERSLGMG